MKVISVRGAKEHNLKDVSLDIPKNKLVAFTGVSGSGKSSLVFDTIYVEAFRRFADASQAPIYVMGNSLWSKTSRPQFRAIKGLPPALGLSQRQGVAGKLSTVGTISGISDLFRVYFAAFGDVFCRNCDIPLRSTPLQTVYSNIMEKFEGRKLYIISPIVEKRKGAFINEIEKFRELGFSKIRINGKLLDLQDDTEKIVIDAKKLNTIEVILDFLTVAHDKQKRIERAVSQALEYGNGIVKIEEPLVKSNSKDQKLICESFNTRSSCPQCGESSPKLDPRYFSHSSLGQCPVCSGTGSSIEGGHSDLNPCASCKGTRLSVERPRVRVYDKLFEELHQVNVPHVAQFVNDTLVPLSQGDKAKLRVVDELARMANMLVTIGLGHLNLNRSGNSLSPGDLQRLRLSSMLSNRLIGALYVLDEPCQGLTSEEVSSLLGVLTALVKKGSSVVVVEHHPVFLKECEWVITMGPGAGSQGGAVTHQANGKNFMADHISKYGKMLTFKKNRAKYNECLEFRNINIRTLQLANLTIPHGKVTIIRGPGGKGKASFLDMCLEPVLNSILEKNPLLKGEYFTVKIAGDVPVENVTYVRPGSMTRSSRKSVASALEVISHLRELFAQLPQSQVLGLTEMSFSWNSKLGKCSHCEGRGYLELMQRYGPSVEIECEVCRGAKLNSRSLLPRFKGLNMADVMNLSLDDAMTQFAHHKNIHSRLARAAQFGLGYVKLGQGMDELSGGELQRLTLTLELKRVQLTGSWFLLVHPGTGLHSPDIKVLGELMRIMVSRGATFVVLENREEFLEYGDHIVQM